MYINNIEYLLIKYAAAVNSPKGPIKHVYSGISNDSMAEWLRRRIRNPVGSTRGGSNPSAVVYITLCVYH